MTPEESVILNHRGCYALYDRGGTFRELKDGDRVEVNLGKERIEMRVIHDFEGYYLEGERISFYPKNVRAKLIEVKERV